MLQDVATAMGLVPPRRLGSLLAQRRTMHGCDLSDMAHRSRGRFSRADLEAAEAGTVQLDDATIEALALLYEVNSTPPSAQRSRLVIADEEDNPGATFVYGFTDDVVVTILQRYVALIYLMRNRPVGEVLRVRSDDAKILASAFGRSEADVVAALERIMTDDREIVEENADRMRRRLIVPAAGLLVGPSPMGMLVLVK